ncbi:MAG: UvrD-helicase domain-containing protein [Parachlamydiales bacterium]
MKNALLNNEQQDAVDHIEGPLLVLAGAGSGKTRVVTMKIAKLIDIGVDPNQILAVTFTNKAANEMVSRVKEITSKNVIICTFHSLGAKILRESIDKIGFTNNFIIYDEEDSLKLLKECLGMLNFKEEKDTLKKIKYKISTCKNELLDIANLDNSLLSNPEIEIFRLYQNKLKSLNAVDFDDLLYLVIFLFKKNPEVLKHYQNKWKFILIDEYQDTNFTQYNLAKLLSVSHQNICVVGDPDQSIYSFRGAKYQNILNFDKDFENAKIIKLEKNYRSTSTILEAANSVIEKNTNRYEKKLYSEKKEGEKIYLFKAASEHLEASFVAEKILKHHLKDKINLNDTAIFYRTNFQSRIFEDILISQNIPYIIYGGISFYQRKEIKDILAFLNLIISDSDFLAFSRTINIINRGFGKTTLNKLFSICEKLNLPIIKLLYEIQTNQNFNEIRLNSAQKENLSIYLNALKELRNDYNQNVPLDELITNSLSKLGYFNYLKEDPDTFEDRKKNVDELVTKAYEWQNEKNEKLDLFLQELTLVSSKIEKPLENSIKLMTLHNSKGLEFECVFIVGLEEDLLPHVNCKNSFEDLEEERRLFYVGMTRAKRYLYLTNSEYRFMWGSSKFSIPSRFIKELPKKCIHDLNNEFKEETDEIPNDYYLGQKIYHSTFGLGVIQKKYQTSLGETLDILFENSQMKSIVTKYAKLKIL